jgi:hypothetical protein
MSDEPQVVEDDDDDFLPPEPEGPFEFGPNKDHWLWFGRVHGPHWPDRCFHAERGGTYVGTVEAVYRTHRERGWRTEIQDVYVHEQYGQHHICLRFGPEDPDYCSCGPLSGFLGERHRDHYGQAVQRLEALGEIRWTPKEPRS